MAIERNHMSELLTSDSGVIADAGQAGVEGQQEQTEPIVNDETTGQDGNGTEGEQAAPAKQQPDKPRQTPEQNREYRERRIRAEQALEEAKQAAQREKDELVAKIFKGQFRTAAEWQAAYDAEVMQQQAEAKGMSAEDYAAWMDTQRKAEEADRRATETEQRLAKYERREEMNKMTAEMESHPQYGAWFKDHRADVLAFADTLDHTQGTAQEQLEMATMLMLAKGYAPPQPVDEAAIEQRGVQKYIESLKKQNAPVEPRGGGIPTTPPAPRTGNAVNDAYRASVDRLTRTPR
jgi:hypothetical protein